MSAPLMPLQISRRLNRELQPVGDYDKLNAGGEEPGRGKRGRGREGVHSFKSAWRYWEFD